MTNSFLTILLLIAIAIIPVAIIMMYVYKKDKNKEPIGLLVQLFIGGIFSCLLVLVISNVLANFFPFMSNYNSYIDVFLHAFVGVALIEELCKFLITYALSYRHKEFNEIYDMLAYAIFVTLGFACFENIFYVFGNESFKASLNVGLQRSITAIPGHACYGLFMGYYLSLAKVSAKRNNKELERNNILKAIFIPTAIHGIYDFCCFAGNVLFLAVFVVFIIVVDIISLKKLNYVAKINRDINAKPQSKQLSPTEENDSSEENNEQNSSTDNNLSTNENCLKLSPPANINQKSSEYFTVSPESYQPVASSSGDNFKFEGAGVPYIPSVDLNKCIDSSVISKQQTAEYVEEKHPSDEIIPIPELKNQSEQQINICPYCGAKLNSDTCQICGHEIKK